MAVVYIKIIEMFVLFVCYKFFAVNQFYLVSL